MKVKSLNVLLVFLIQLTSTRYQVLTEDAPYRVVVVGAGLSGYSAAAKLLENEVDNIIILEAENRTGGRVHSVPHGTGFRDMGAQWVHGQGRNLIYEMIDGHFDFGDGSFPNATPYFYHSDGTFANQSQIGRLANLSETIMTNVHQQEPSYLGTFGSFFSATYSRLLPTPAYNDIPWNLAIQVQNFFHVTTNNYFGSRSWFDISILAYSTHNYTTGNQWLTWRDQGFQTVFEYISRRLPNSSEALDVDSKIHHNKEVTNIAWEDDIAVLRCADGTNYSAEYVIFTAPLGVLKDRHESLFTPPLPEAKISAIENIEFGSLEKVFLEYASPFWNENDDFGQFSILWTQEDIPILFNNSNEWLLDIAYLTRVDGFPNLLATFFIGGRFPNLDFLTEQKIIEDSTWMLRRFLGQQIPSAIRAYRSDWITNRNFLGSYSLLTMNSAHHGATPSVLAEIVYNDNGRPRIFFAGEATSSAFSGYSHGAVETGYRAAEEVIEHGSGSDKLSKNLLVLMFMLLASFLRG